jgi:tetratricopeptide (TPR) repeat protein
MFRATATVDRLRAPASERRTRAWARGAALLVFALTVRSGFAEDALVKPAEGDQREAYVSYQRSLDLVTREISSRPASPELDGVLARVHYRSSRFEEAARVFETALAKYPTHAELLAGLGATRLAQGDGAAAVEAFRRALDHTRLGEKRVQYLASFADALYRANRFEDSATALRSVIAMGQRDARTLYALARAIDSHSRELGVSAPDESRRRGEEAASVLEQSISLQPDLLPARYLHGRLLLRLGHAERGRTELETFRRMKGDGRVVSEELVESAERSIEAQTAVELARAVFEIGDPKRALEIIEGGAASQPDHVPTLALRGWILLRERRGDEALAAYQAVLAVQADHSEALWNIGKIWLERGEKELAAQHLLAAAEKRRSAEGPRSAEVWEFLSDLASSGRLLPERAEPFAELALSMRPVAENYSRYALALFEAGKLERCEQVLRAGLQRYPKSPELQEGIELLRRRKEAK